MRLPEKLALSCESKKIKAQNGADAGENIWVTKPSLPPLEDFLPYLESIWESKILTNGGPFHQQLESALCEYLGVEHISLFANGTLALVTALQALGIKGEVITTPYSFVATSHALVWNGIEPVFVDIDPNTCNLDPNHIEAAVTERTSAILAVHCYGTPCDVEAIQKIADRHRLPVIYDAAHAFGVQDSGGSVLRHGDLTVLSFHATKVFSTFEGGAIVCPNAEVKQHIDHLKNFGFVDETIVVATGINGKMSEIHAAMGLLQLKHIDQAIFNRKLIDNEYRSRLRDLSGIRCLNNNPKHKANYSYFPILVQEKHFISRDELYHRLKQHNIHTRRYFYPIISEFPMYSRSALKQCYGTPLARKVSEQILCLPIYPDLSLWDIEKICSIILAN